MQTNEELEDFMDKTAWTLDAQYHKPDEVCLTRKVPLIKTLVAI